jgi:hypothetical protein
MEGYGVINKEAHREANTVPEGTPFRRIRLDDDLWDRFDEAVKRADPDSNRSAVVRKFLRWFVGDIDDMPQRPPKQDEK